MNLGTKAKESGDREYVSNLQVKSYRASVGGKRLIKVNVQ